jgi:predicted nuclease of predicted toxin-antitoxin system
VRLLAGESCDFNVVRTLRGSGHDVAAIVELIPGATDEEVIAFSVREGRMLITEDKDFGRLVYAAKKPSTGVILIRFPATARAALLKKILDTVTTHAEKLANSFTVIQPERIRISRSP